MTVSDPGAEFPSAAPRLPVPPARTLLGVPRRTLTVVSLLALVAGAAGGMAGTWASERLNGESALPAAAPAASIDRPEGSIAQIAQQTLPSVVQIEAVSGGTVASTGSGFVIRDDGYILTNNHVVALGDDGLLVTFSDGTEEDATVVGTTVEYDIAVIHVNLDGLVPLTLGDSDAIVVGDSVLAFGAPLGLDSTVTSGIVSALHRPVQVGDPAATPTFIDAIQTDASINPGNSGGPLLNSAGEVIGITSASASITASGPESQTGSIGLGFAIPSNQARRTAEEIISTGHATFPVVGVLLDTSYIGEGVRVSADAEDGSNPGVIPGGPADTAGIKAGDIIVSIDGRPVTRPKELIVAIRAKAGGDVVVLGVKSGDTVREVEVTLTSSDDVTWNDGSEK